MKKTSLLILLFLILFVKAYSQVLNPVKWNFSSEKISDEIYELRFEAKIDKGWHMYGLNIPSGGPVATSFTFENENNILFLTKVEPIEKPVTHYDSTFSMEVELFSKEVVFVRKLKLNTEVTQTIKGTVTFMTCDDSRCLPPKDVEFSFNLPENKTTQGNRESKREQTSSGTLSGQDVNSANQSAFSKQVQLSKPNTNILKTEAEPVGSGMKTSLLSLFLLAFLAGFGAILTPCVYPIIPLTVSYFIRNTARSKAIVDGIFFGASIVFIYTAVGFITGLFRIDLARLVSSYWLPNLIFFLIFLALAFSFFGMFEITLPGKLSNKIDQQADKGGIMGPFFMALATVIISFSCTGPIVGVVLGSALQGEIIRPVVGMFAFSLSFALPFTLLAIFPGFMKNLPKSGGWLNSVKVFFAFILLAFSLIFLSNLGWKFITRDVILSIAIVIFFLLGLYLTGKLKFAHDSDLAFISVPRLMLAIAAFSFALYMIPGLFGAPLKSISPFLPPKEEMSFDLTRNTISAVGNTTGLKNINLCDAVPKYSGFLYMPLGLTGYFDYEEALACARQLKKPVLLDFAGHGCKNCKKMYSEVWSDPRVLEKLEKDFVIAVLFTDDWTKLDLNDQTTSKIDGKVKNTIGKKFSDLEIELFGSNSLPLYAIVNCDGKVLTERKYYEYDPDINGFLEFLNNGLKNFSAGNTD
jgi:thiol:disulfide interchange protein